MISSESIAEIGNVKVTTISKRGFTPEELAEQAGIEPLHLDTLELNNGMKRFMAVGYDSRS